MQLDGYRHGDLLARMVGDVDALQNLHLRAVGSPLAALAAGAVAVGVTAAFLAPEAVLLAAALLAGGVAVPALAGALGRRVGRRQAPARGELAAELVELLRAAPELVVCDGGQAALRRIGAADRALARLSRRDAPTGGLADALGLAPTGETVAGVLAVSAQASAAGRLDPVLIACSRCSRSPPSRPSSPSRPRRGRCRRQSERAAGSSSCPIALSRWSTPWRRRLAPARRAPSHSKGCARYPGAVRPVLDGFSLRLDPGRRVALVGPSGAGKTTVVNLLPRFLDPEAGRVTIAGRDLRGYRQEDVRRTIAIAGQDSHVFSASIRDNVRLGRGEADDVQVERALRRAHLWAWDASLPDGLDTPVGEDGRALSGGQRQRLVPAHALVADTPVLVLDEPTAHLDPQTATELVADLLSAAGDRSVVLITHRPEGLDRWTRS